MKNICGGCAYYCTRCGTCHYEKEFDPKKYNFSIREYGELACEHFFRKNGKQPKNRQQEKPE